MLKGIVTKKESSNFLTNICLDNTKDIKKKAKSSIFFSEGLGVDNLSCKKSNKTSFNHPRTNWAINHINIF